ncbi:helix-turn-helix domain-containing protein [Flagellimonas zhangzhouensis]|uniref:Two-component response regulator, YesN/AraC family, consists of REC and AraC-type DNA-binding domains n=1 Tax=Flagellimonas zhangzhouensis TaxID=1073328 RepID=A0A1H2QLA4_9FLAO|nr:helix-turn-helix domain-containing protein [Allomuricauda zhangzhouensis]SDQ54522.1 Two-component response regulator, YesN/AraC family, consists of REC and AraC-type DNA-binding domains [Allomuricauda zhangzhouensis]SDW07921.1 Two-component response regulator, YesN/AraC family, consists of REC and AraC-type DNA-binding domains [Allomuricauda zhangzhouensis]
MLIRRTWIILLFLSIVSVYGHEITSNTLQPYLDGIKKLVENQQFPKLEDLLAERANASGEKRIDVNLELYTYYIFKSTEFAKKYNDEANALSKDLNYEKGYLRSIGNQAFIYFIEGQFDKSMELACQLESNEKLQDFSKIKADTETLKSYIFTERGEYDLAYETALNLLEEGDDAEDSYTRMRAYSAISHFYLRLGEYEKALDNCLHGLDYILELKEGRFIFPKIDEIARMTHKLKGSKEALEIYDFYLELEESIEAPGDYIQSVVYMNIATIYIEELELDKAQDFLNKAFDIIEANNYRFRKPRAHVLMALLHLKQGDSITAQKDYNNAYQSAKEIKAFDVIKEVSKELSLLNKAMGYSDEAEYFTSLYLSVSDSLFSVESEQRLRILEARRRISEISRQKEILEIKSKSQEERYRLLFIIFAITLISGFFATLSYFKVKRKNKLLFYRTKELAVEKLNQKKRVEIGEVKEVKTSVAKASTTKSYLDEDVKEIILTKLNRLEDEAFFLNSKCSLHSLAEVLQTNQKYLSQVINHEKNANFSNYINDLRINYLLNRLLEDKEYRNSKLAYIATTSGFNNLNTFYSAFKKRLGILPSYFIEKLNEDEAKRSF